MSQLVKYFTTLVYVIVVAIIFVIIWLVTRKKKKGGRKTAKPDEDAKFSMRDEFQKLMAVQKSKLKN